jgi:hypothetical protein
LWTDVRSQSVRRGDVTDVDAERRQVVDRRLVTMVRVSHVDRERRQVVDRRPVTMVRELHGAEVETGGITLWTDVWSQSFGRGRQ